MSSLNVGGGGGATAATPVASGAARDLAGVATLSAPRALLPPPLPLPKPQPLPSTLLSGGGRGSYFQPVKAAWKRASKLRLLSGIPPCSRLLLRLPWRVVPFVALRI